MPRSGVVPRAYACSVSSPTANKHLVRVTVFGSVLGAAVAAVLISTPAKLPGAALGSVLVLRVEWAVALFAALLLLTVVLLRAWQGLLPSEISGRGVKYADADKTQAAVNESAEALDELRSQLGTLRRELLELQAADDGGTGS
jgi:hypothetical protein